MKFRIRSSDPKLVIYRDKWEVSFLTGAGGLGALAFALLFYKISETANVFSFILAR